MCGRYGLFHELQEIAEWFDLRRSFTPLEARYNVAPSEDAPVIRAIDDGHELVKMHWGLVPFWAKDPSIGHKMINARAEGIGARPAFKDSLRKRRCIVPVSGFYEWQKQPDGKQPYFFADPHGEPMGLAGIWSQWKDRSGAVNGVLESFTIITTAANRDMEEIHDRMPVILQPEDYEAWLSVDMPMGLLPDLLAPYGGRLKRHPVSRSINRPAMDVPELIHPLNSA